MKIFTTTAAEYDAVVTDAFRRPRDGQRLCAPAFTAAGETSVAGMQVVDGGFAESIDLPGGIPPRRALC